MGSTTKAHAGFLLKGKDFWRVLPHGEGSIVFGTYTYAPFLEEHYIQLIGKTFKKQFQPSCWSGKRPSKLTYTLIFNPPLESRPDIPFSLVMTKKFAVIRQLGLMTANFLVIIAGDGIRRAFLPTAKAGVSSA